MLWKGGSKSDDSETTSCTELSHKYVYTSTQGNTLYSFDQTFRTCGCSLSCDIEHETVQEFPDLSFRMLVI